MSSPIKDNAQILADQKSFMDAYERAREAFGKIEGVVDVGYGQKESGGEFHDDIAIVVFVREKKGRDELSLDERIPPDFEGYQTDVVVVPVGTPSACENKAAYAVVQGGIQIVPEIHSADGSYDAGTLGCIVRRRGDTSRENVYLLTCKHVLFYKGSGASDYVYHPFARPPQNTPPAGPSDTLGPIQEVSFEENVSYTIPGTDTTRRFWIDCAIARINIDSRCCGSTCTHDVIHYAGSIIDLHVGTDDPATPEVHEDNLIADVRSVIDAPTMVGQRVYKVGRSTGKTTGILRRLAGAVDMRSDPNDPSSPMVSALGVMFVDFDPASEPTTHKNCLGHERFGEHGDSGSVMVDEQRRVIGLVFAASPATVNGQPAPNGSTFVCHIYPVLDKLGICVEATGNSRGTSRATDGTGTAPAATASIELEDASSGFAAERVEGTLLRPALEPQPIAVTDVERERLLRLRDEFRRTPQGRELHYVFGQVRREVGYLVRNSRPVKVAWYRGQGPAFLAHTLNHLRGQSEAVPLEVNGVSRAELLTRMARVLSEHGSNPLRAAIERYQDDLLPILSSAATVHECVALFRESETAAAPEPHRAGELAAAVRERDDQ
jgi:hypothetical protein